MFATSLISAEGRGDLKPERKEGYTRRAHSVCRLTYHAVFVVKYRRKVISSEIIALTFMEQRTKYLIEECFGGILMEFNGEPDHIHILFELPPSAAPSMVICSLKTQLSREVAFFVSKLTSVNPSYYRIKQKIERREIYE